MKSGMGDYHLVVAHNFLSNISLDGSHEDTNLRMFNRHHHGSTVAFAEPPEATDAESVSTDEDDLPLIEKRSFNTYTAGRSESPTSSLFSGTSSRKSKPPKKLSVLQRFVRMVSADDVSSKREAAMEEKASSTLGCSTRKSEASDKASADDRPISPASITQFTFLRRLRTSLAKGDRSFLCPSSGAPLIVVSHFPFTSARARSRLHHSRSSIGSTERLQNTTGDSVEELRPFDFSEVECVHFEQLGCKLRRSSLAAGGVAWKSPSKDDRRASDLRQSTTLSLASVGTVTARESTESRGDLTAEEDSYKLAAENRRQSDYDPKILDEILQIIGLPHLSLVKGVSKTYASAQAIKATLNETFANKYPNIHITYSKLRSIKRDILLIAKECDIDEYAVAHAFVYFERIIFKGLISKYNRKLVAGVALLVAVKLNDYKKPDIVKVLECAEEKLRISRREMLSFELPLCSALQFDLFPPAHHLEPHLRKIMYDAV